MTASDIYAKPARVPREKQFPIRIVLPMTAEMLASLDAIRGDEPRVDVIRVAVERELKRRKAKR